MHHVLSAHSWFHTRVQLPVVFSSDTVDNVDEKKRIIYFQTKYLSPVRPVSQRDVLSRRRLRENFWRGSLLTVGGDLCESRLERQAGQQEPETGNAEC